MFYKFLKKITRKVTWYGFNTRTKELTINYSNWDKEVFTYNDWIFYSTQKCFGKKHIELSKKLKILMKNLNSPNL